MLPHAVLVAAISGVTILGFLGVIAVSWRPRKDERDPGELPLAV